MQHHSFFRNLPPLFFYQYAGWFILNLPVTTSDIKQLSTVRLNHDQLCFHNLLSSFFKKIFSKGNCSSCWSRKLIICCQTVGWTGCWWVLLRDSQLINCKKKVIWFWFLYFKGHEIAHQWFGNLVSVKQFPDSLGSISVSGNCPLTPPLAQH